MTRVSTDQYIKGILFNGYDYVNQAWVANGVYVACGHPQFMQCSCYGRLHAGEQCKAIQNGHLPDCDAPDRPYYNEFCSLDCPLQDEGRPS